MRLGWFHDFWTHDNNAYFYDKEKFNYVMRGGGIGGAKESYFAIDVFRCISCERLYFVHWMKIQAINCLVYAIFTKVSEGLSTP